MTRTDEVAKQTLSNKGRGAKLHDGDDAWQVSQSKAVVVLVARNRSEFQLFCEQDFFLN